MARRIRTNTPLQALTLLNDSVYLDASRHLAYQMRSSAPSMQPTSPQIAAAIRQGYTTVLFHPIGDASLAALQQLYNTAYARFSHDPDKTREMVGMEEKHNNPSTAALVVVANAILNLDEVITKN